METPNILFAQQLLGGRQRVLKLQGFDTRPDISKGKLTYSIRYYLTSSLQLWRLLPGKRFVKFIKPSKLSKFNVVGKLVSLPNKLVCPDFKVWGWLGGQCKLEVRHNQTRDLERLLGANFKVYDLKVADIRQLVYLPVVGFTPCKIGEALKLKASRACRALLVSYDKQDLAELDQQAWGQNQDRFAQNLLALLSSASKQSEADKLAIKDQDRAIELDIKVNKTAYKQAVLNSLKVEF